MLLQFVCRKFRNVNVTKRIFCIFMLSTCIVMSYNLQIYGYKYILSGYWYETRLNLSVRI